MLFHLLHAVIVGVDEVKGQRAGQWTTPSAGGHAEKPATHTNKHTQTSKKDGSDEQSHEGRCRRPLISTNSKKQKMADVCA